MADAAMPTSSQNTITQDGLTYLTGLHNHHESEAEPSTLPRGRNNPQRVPGNLYTEQLSGTAFTAPRATNRKSWLYRIQPGVAGTSSSFMPYQYTHGDDEKDGQPSYFGQCDWSTDLRLDPNPMRWGPMPLEEEGCVNFVEGTRTMMASGDPAAKSGLAIHFYSFNADMMPSTDDCGGGGGDVNTHMYNSDGDLLIVPQRGSLLLLTELGRLIVHPAEICVIPRGIVFSVNMYRTASETSSPKAAARGYILELFKGHFTLPELGPIGSNGLANPRDFLYPVAWYDESSNKNNFKSNIVNKFGNELFVRTTDHSPFNVVAWHGTYAPFKYDLHKFCAMNSVTYDHPDPSIYTVLTAQSDEPGTAMADFVIFPPRIMATDDNTFRPPWFHRNVMAEFMGLIYGKYDAKREGFVPGGASLHNTMTPHGPDTDTYGRAVEADCSTPSKFEGGLAFMFETCLTLKCSSYALTCPQRQMDYAKCWDGLKDNFTKWQEDRKRRGIDCTIDGASNGDHQKRAKKN